MVKKYINDIPIYKFRKWEDWQDFDHFVTTTQGGFSHAPYGGFNLGNNTAEDQSIIQRNYQKLRSALSNAEMIIPQQCHGNRVQIIEETFLNATSETRKAIIANCDALVTNQKNMYIAVQTADCVPILFYARKKNVIGVAHAGWKGTVAEIAKQVVEVMKSNFGVELDEIEVAIGPCIRVQHYEVGEELKSQFAAIHAQKELDQIFQAKKDALHLDLVLSNILQLQKMGISKASILDANISTYNASEFYSYRKQNGDTGRFITGISLKKGNVNDGIKNSL